VEYCENTSRKLAKILSSSHTYGCSRTFNRCICTRRRDRVDPLLSSPPTAKWPVDVYMCIHVYKYVIGCYCVLLCMYTLLRYCARTWPADVRMCMCMCMSMSMCICICVCVCVCVCDKTLVIKRYCTSICVAVHECHYNTINVHNDNTLYIKADTNERVSLICTGRDNLYCNQQQDKNSRRT
jgi:hypothetical protein